MRIWSLHPKYLDSKGLVALWREALLAQKVLYGKTKGYINHPQLERFKSQRKPVAAINTYLRHILEEAKDRSYKFNSSKIGKSFQRKHMYVTKGQIDFEREHLLKKLKQRNRDRFNVLKNTNVIDAHPLFIVVNGGIEEWEILD
jgi:hypothetical protein